MAKNGKTKSMAKAKSGGKTSAKKAPAASAGRKGGPRMSWLDAKNKAPAIEQYARQLGTFIEAMADGVIEESEVAEQEGRVTKLMKEIEPKLDDAMHEKVTRLLCELTAYDIMQMLNTMHQSRPQTRFRG